VRISAKADYGIRALIELAAREAATGAPVKRDQIGANQEIPVAFLENILLELKRAGIVRSVRGQQGGFLLARPTDGITVADIIRALEGPLASVRGVRPEDLDYPGAAAPLRDVWVAVRAGLRAALEGITLADLLAGELPEPLRELTDAPEAWDPH
jgi:Rrf2 family protein